jgi:hypothetical protein
MLRIATVPNSRGIGAVFAEVACGFCGTKAKESEVMGPCPEGKHVGGEKLPMQPGDYLEVVSSELDVVGYVVG